MRSIAGQVLEDIRRQRSVGPGGVLRALRERLGPVLSEAELEVLRIPGRATWQALWALYPAFVFRGGPQGQRDGRNRNAGLTACLHHSFPELRRMPPPCPPAWQLDSQSVHVSA